MEFQLDNHNKAQSRLPRFELGTFHMLLVCSVIAIILRAIEVGMSISATSIAVVILSSYKSMQREYVKRNPDLTEPLFLKLYIVHRR